MVGDVLSLSEAEKSLGLAEGRALLESLARSFNADAIYREYAAKYNLPDLSHLSPEQLADEADCIINEMNPDTRAAMEREGLI